jgi:hypothetical protein
VPLRSRTSAPSTVSTSPSSTRLCPGKYHQSLCLSTAANDDAPAVCFHNNPQLRRMPPPHQPIPSQDKRGPSRHSSPDLVSRTSKTSNRANQRNHFLGTSDRSSSSSPVYPCQASHLRIKAVVLQVFLARQQQTLLNHPLQEEPRILGVPHGIRAILFYQSRPLEVVHLPVSSRTGLGWEFRYSGNNRNHNSNRTQDLVPHFLRLLRIKYNKRGVSIPHVSIL